MSDSEIGEVCLCTYRIVSIYILHAFNFTENVSIISEFVEA